MMNPNNGGYYGQQQQQQYNNNNNSNMYGQQQQYNNNGAYGQPQQGMCNCCGPDPNQQQPGQQPTMCPMCCPEDPNTHFCVTDPMPQPGQMPATFSCLWQFCDGSTWLVALFFLLSVVGFAITVGMKSPDDLLGALSVANNLELDKAVSGNLLIGATSTAATPTPAPSGTNTNATTTTPAPVTATSSPATSASSAFCSSALCGRTSCTSPSSLSGSFGTVCMEDTLTGVAMLMNQSRWLNFRGALYFLAMLCSGVLLIIIVIVNKQQQFIAAGGQPGMQMPPQQQPMPYQFHGTPLYYSFRIAWGTVAIIVFFWMVTELYQYWWFIGYYIKETSGDLSSFWYWFDRKFVPSTICVGLFLCWPLVHLCLELGLFIVGIIPWYLIRQSCYTQLQTVTVDPEKPFDHHSCCVRTDMFYMGNHQMHRLGFSEGQWTMWTGNKMPFCTMCECQQQQPGQYGGGTYGGGGLSANTSMTAGKPPRPMNSMNMAPSVPPPMGAASRSITSAADMRGSFQTQQSMNLEMQQSSAVFGPQDGGKTPKKSKKDKKDKGEDGDTKKDKKKKKDKSSKSDRESD